MTEIEALLAQSSAADDFKTAIRHFAEGHSVQDHIVIEGFPPRIKVLRVLAQMLDAEPELDIRRVAVRGRSGCSDFVGTIEVDTPEGHRAFDFVWDCRWRAEQEGWTDFFGFPDQTRAAQEYGWRCFQHWRSRHGVSLTSRTPHGPRPT